MKARCLHLLTVRPWLWLLCFTSVAVLLGVAVVKSGTIVDTDVSAFVVRGTLISNRKVSSGVISRYVTPNAPRHYPPPSTPTPGVTPAPPTGGTPAPPLPPTPPAPFCHTIRDTDMEILLTTNGDNVLKYPDVVSMCFALDEFENSTVWSNSCFGAVHYLDPRTSCNHTIACTRPLWLLSIPDIIQTHPLAENIVQFTRTVRDLSALDQVEGFKKVCNDTRTIPCEAREVVGCPGPCADPCIVHNIDLCMLLLETNATADELRAVANTPVTRLPCSDLTEAYVDSLLASMKVVTKWSKRSNTADAVLPLHGGRALFDTQHYDTSDKLLESKYTRVTLQINKDELDSVPSVAKQITDIAGKHGFSLVWREWATFQSELLHQLLLDGRWAVGSIVVVVVYTSFYSKSLFLSFGAIAGIVLCLPITFAVYRFVLGIRWVGVLHLIGLFLVAGVGTDDFFVILAHYRKAEADKSLPTLHQKVSRAISESLVTVSATTLTTAGAFLGNYTSDIAPIKLFGLFMAVLMVCLLITVALWFPTLLFLYGRRRMTEPGREGRGSVDVLEGEKEEVDAALQAVLSGEREELSELDDDEMDECMMEVDTDPPAKSWTELLVVDVVLQWHNHIAVVLVIIVGLCLATATQLHGPDGEITLWPSDHNQAKYMKTELKMDTDVGRTDIRLTWGVIPVDTGDLLDPSSKTHLELDPTFDGTTEAAQMYFLRVCKELEDMKGKLAHVLRRGSLKCPMLDIDRWLRDERNSSLPLKKDQFVSEIGVWWWEGAFRHREYAEIYYNHGVPRVFTMWVGTTMNWQQPYKVLKPQWEEWEEWMDGTNPPKEVGKGFHSAGGTWVTMETQVELKRTATYSLGISLLLAFAVLLIAGRNVIASLVATCCIGGAAVCFIAFMVLAGWSLGVIESICMTIVIGMSCDYTVHIASEHCHMKHQTQEERIKATLLIMAPPVISASCTTIGASLFLLNCIIVFLSKFGGFISLTLAAALVLALYGYPSFILALTDMGVQLDSFVIPICCNMNAHSKARYAPCETHESPPSSPDTHMQPLKSVGKEDGEGAENSD